VADEIEIADRASAAMKTQERPRILRGS